MNDLTKYFLLGAVVLILSACDSFLDESPKYNLTKEHAVTDYTSAQNIVNGIYSKFTGKYIGGEIMGRLSSQAGIWAYDQLEAYYAMAYRQGSNDGTDIWLQLYTIVNAANAAIEGISGVENSKFPTVEDKNRLVAEARCVRAFAYTQIFWLWSHWWEKADSPYGLVYRSEVSDLSNLIKTRLSVGDSYARIIEDLKYAETHLNDFKSSRYASRQLAQVTHAKLLLYRGWEGDYAEALALVQNVKTHAPASFALETDLAKMYQDSWDSKEVLFARYLGDLSNITQNEFYYSYGLYYQTELYPDPQSWVKNDPRYPIITAGTVRTPEAWDASFKTGVYTKLYRSGRYAGPNDKYATYYFRYPELYLLESELKFRLNPSDIAAALAPINEMRSKYTNPALPPLTASNQTELSDLIFKEIVVTLFLENGSEWFASLRFLKDGKPWLHTLKPDVSISSDKYCWPIPDAEIINQEHNVIQNPSLE
ncbi:MAG: RagB/SusD family nutrient uptake outer membrane protein [Dysgonamonadaceae bacterium]|jgi:hypothetical protein|nr:RagB/SusD family nutrient uptake outer membrane protein [Dysgonamonadaceae bacterium]